MTIFQRRNLTEEKELVFARMENDPELILAGSVDHEKANWLAQRGDQLASAGKIQEATDDLEEAVLLDPSNIMPYLPLAMCYLLKTKNEDKTVETLKHGLAIPVLASEIPYYRANMNFQLGQHYLKNKDATSARNYLHEAMQIIDESKNDQQQLETIRKTQEKMNLKTDIIAEIAALELRIRALINILERGDFSAW